MIQFTGFLILLLIHCSSVFTTEDLGEQSDSHFRILASLETNEGNHIVAMTDDGQRQMRITTGPNDWYPVWLSSKNTILFLSDRNVAVKVPLEEDDPFYHPKAHLYIQEMGGLSRQLTFGEHNVWLPEPSPDGKFIAFLSDQDESFGDLYIIAVDTGIIERITTKKQWPMESATWLSPNQLSFNMYMNDTLELYAFDLNTKQLNQVTRSVPRTKNGYLSLSSDHKHYAFVSRDRNSDDAAGIVNPQIFIMDIDGKNRRQLTYNNFINFMPSWSPNGQQIVFLREQLIEGEINHQLRIIDKEGKREHQLCEHLLSYPKWLTDSVILYISKIDGHKRIMGFDLTKQRSYTISKNANDFHEFAVRPLLDD